MPLRPEHRVMPPRAVDRVMPPSRAVHRVMLAMTVHRALLTTTVHRFMLPILISIGSGQGDKFTRATCLDVLTEVMRCIMKGKIQKDAPMDMSSKLQELELS